MSKKTESKADNLYFDYSFGISYFVFIFALLYCMLNVNNMAKEKGKNEDEKTDGNEEQTQSRPYDGIVNLGLGGKIERTRRHTEED